jgi:hypothetical protein
MTSLEKGGGRRRAGKGRGVELLMTSLEEERKECEAQAQEDDELAPLRRRQYRQ